MRVARNDEDDQDDADPGREWQEYSQGIVGPSEGSKAREVLITVEEFETDSLASVNDSDTNTPEVNESEITEETTVLEESEENWFEEIRKLEANELEIGINPKIRQSKLQNKIYPEGRSTQGKAGTRPRKKR